MKFVMFFNVLTFGLFGLVLVLSIAVLRLKKKQDISYLLFLTVFFIYLFKVLDLTLFQFQSLILLKYFVPGLVLNGQTVGKNINLIPLISLTAEDLKTSLLNILLMMPFGFGLPFITNFHFKKVVIGGVLFSLAIELLQLISGIVFNVTFRVCDINDVIFNVLGVSVGYVFFIVFMRMYRLKTFPEKTLAHPMLRHITKRTQR